MIKPLAGALVLLILAVGLLWWRLDAAQERAVTAEAQAAQNAATANAWKLALEAETARAAETDQLLADTRRAHDRLRTKTDQRIRTYEEALRHDPTATDWDAVPVPAAVAGRMCQYRVRRPPGDGPLPEAATGAAGADPDPACRPSNGHLWRWAERLVETAEKGNQDKAALREWAEHETAE